MLTYTKRVLSGSTDGKGILINATAYNGTTIHTAVAGTSDLDEVWLYCVNTSALDVKLTIEYGGTTDPNDTIEFTVPAEAGLYAIVPGLILNNSQAIKAYAGTTGVLVIHGFVNRITV